MSTRRKTFGPADMDFEAVYNAHVAYVHALLRRFGVRQQDARDISQEIFLAVHLQLPQFERRSMLRTWLYSICAHKASDYRSRARRCREMPTAAPPERHAHGGPEHNLLARQRLTVLEQALASLPSKLARVFVLHEIEQRPMSEVVELLGCPLFTGYTRLRTARDAVLALCAKDTCSPERARRVRHPQTRAREQFSRVTEQCESRLDS
jgi:RNA polymerase sigma-70 factor (ECF subfamily)